MRRFAAFFREWGRLLVRGDQLFDIGVRLVVALLLLLGVVATLQVPLELFLGSHVAAYIDLNTNLGIVLLSVAVFVYASLTAGAAWVRSNASPLEVSTGTNHPHQYRWSDGYPVHHNTLHRIRILNRSVRTITGIVAKLTGLDPRPVTESLNPADLIPVPLRLMNTAHTVREFTLRPKEDRYVDVIQLTRVEGSSPLMTLWHSLSESGDWIPPRDYKLHITIYCDGHQAQNVTLELQLRGDDSTMVLARKM